MTYLVVPSGLNLRTMHAPLTKQLDLECAAICRSAAEVMSPESGFSAHYAVFVYTLVIIAHRNVSNMRKMGMEHCAVSAPKLAATALSFVSKWLHRCK
ncbi:hypothetical protein [Dyadobacter sp. CY343]|uniref:hypothetical protein n=1 Tax=Dyadobacter sp. CY343 TaxID=2907299 RepID=UPI001F1D237B|nr:hypothetical protein [Dyadobacter sp. CY343]MCE7063185.1 hypothetical protein [Dyadobacter sp. CY343]